MSNIHPSAIIEKGAELGNNVTIGPFCHIGAGVHLGEGAVLHSHVTIGGNTHIEENCEFFPFAAIGHKPQDVKYGGEPNRLEIGKNTICREYVCVHPGTGKEKALTKIGAHCLLMLSSHVGHDCSIGEHVIISNGSQIGGHCQVNKYAIIGGMCAIHQFCRVGEYAFTAGGAIIVQDVIPFGMAVGNQAHHAGLNIVGLKRNKFSSAEIRHIHAAYTEIFHGEGEWAARLSAAKEKYADMPHIQRMLDFILEPSERGICSARGARGVRTR